MSVDVTHRPWPVVLANTVLMLGVLAALPYGLACLAHWDVRATLGGLALVVAATWLGLLVYRGAVRCEAKAADHASVFTSVLAVLGGLAVTTSFVAWVESGVELDFAMCLLLIGATAAVGWCAAVNRAWAAQRCASDEDVHGRQMTLREVFLVMTVLASVFAVARWHVQGFSRGAAMHVTRDESPINLPDDAEDVSYAQSFLGLSVEFACTEPSARRWVHEIGSSRGETRPIGPGVMEEPFVRLTPPSTPHQRLSIEHGWRYRDFYGAAGNDLSITYDYRTCRVYYQRRR